jgi:hypothetical protein
MKIKTIAIISILIATGYFLYKKNMQGETLTTGKCCQKCKEGENKYYSIITKNNKCGESCLKPNIVWFIKIFEPGMILAENDNPCETHGYPISTTTISHGFPIKVSIDFYEKEEPK